MKIILNGNPLTVEAEITIQGLLAFKGLEPSRVVVEYNFQILNRDQWETTVLKENDTIEILKFVGGG